MMVCCGGEIKKSHKIEGLMGWRVVGSIYLSRLIASTSSSTCAIGVAQEVQKRTMS